MRESLSAERNQVELPGRGSGSQHDECFWSLVGLSPEFTGRGLGYETWNAMLQFHKGEGVYKVRTSISSHNIAVMNLYTKIGFRFSEPEITLHWHPEGSKILGQ